MARAERCLASRSARAQSSYSATGRGGTDHVAGTKAYTYAFQKRATVLDTEVSRACACVLRWSPERVGAGRYSSTSAQPPSTAASGFKPRIDLNLGPGSSALATRVNSPSCSRRDASFCVDQRYTPPLLIACLHRTIWGRAAVVSATTPDLLWKSSLAEQIFSATAARARPVIATLRGCSARAVPLSWRPAPLRESCASRPHRH